MAISRRLKGWQVYRIAFFIPVMMSGVVVATLWANMFEFNHGLFNTVLRGIGLDGLVQNWLGDRNVALISVMMVPIWQSVGFPMIVLLASIEGIPQEMHDAATMDGVSEWQRIWGLIVPLIKPVLASITMLSIIGAMKVFDLVLVMTKRRACLQHAGAGLLSVRDGFPFGQLRLRFVNCGRYVHRRLHCRLRLCKGYTDRKCGILGSAVFSFWFLVFSAG